MLVWLLLVWLARVAELAESREPGLAEQQLKKGFFLS